MKRLLALLLLAAPAAGLAHSPARIQPGAPLTVKDPTVSWGFYGEFVTGEEIFELRFTLDRDFAAPFEILVPHQSELADHRPAYAIVCPGLPEPTAEERAALPDALPGGSGAFVELDDTPKREVVFEGFLRRVYWSSGAIAVVVPKGDCRVWIWSPKHTRGKVTLAFGVEENPGGSDYGDLLSHWSHYDW
jgi:hypothetical protein